VSDVQPTDRSAFPDRWAGGYAGDVVAAGGRAARTPLPRLPLELDLVVEVTETGWCGAVVRWERTAEGHTVTLEDRLGRHRVFPLGAGFEVDGRPVELVRPAAGAGPRRQRTASGSVAVLGGRARVAQASRIYVEGPHDADLVERVWGDDLRVEGVVVEALNGIDDLAAVVRDFAPAAGRRLGVLVDHLVPGTKEWTIAAEVLAAGNGHVRVVGHPFVDIWEAVKPAAVGIEGWPVVPRGEPWKEGVCRRLGWPADPAAAWRRILASVSSYAELEPELLSRVEELIDFVTGPAGSL